MHTIFQKTITLVFALASSFLLLASPVSAQEIKLHCFKADECAAAPYKGILSAEQAPECANEPEGRQFYCYAPPIKVCPPDKPAQDCAVKLQVSIGGQDIQGLEGYIAALYKYLIAISGILAGIMIVWAGVKWLMSAGNTEMISDAKHKIGGAIIGLILVVISYVLLQTINPALVTLKLPPIKMSRRLDLMMGGFCTTASGIECGKPLKDCGTNPEACGGTAVGSCVGQVCPNPSPETCATVIPEKNLTTYNIYPQKGGEKEYSCVNPQTQCQDCKSITIAPSDCLISAGGGTQTKCWNAATCMSSACNCVVMSGVDEKGKPTKPVCQPAKTTGKSCQSNAECASGICNLDDNECVPPGGNPGGTDCKQNIECASKICNTEADPDECVPVGGYQKNDATCEPDSEDIGGANVNAQCGGSGWKCIDRADWIPGEADGVCSNGELGAPCITGADCKSNNCDNDWAKADGKCI